MALFGEKRDKAANGPTVNEALVPVEGQGLAPLVTVLRASGARAPERRAPERRAPEPVPPPALALALEPASSGFAPSPASFAAAARPSNPSCASRSTGS
jgi:hypothetical protein